MSKIPVMEIFGPTVQGEGMVIGRKTMFVRTGGCDYVCAWCDSKFTWDGSQKSTPMEPDDILSELRRLGGNSFDYVTISGGNPALIGHPMAELIDLLHQNRMYVGLETQGSKWQDWFLDIDDLTLSPKPPSSGMLTDWDMFDKIVAGLSQGDRNVSFKVVVFDDDDYEYAKFVHNRWPSVPLFLSVGNDDTAAPGPVADRLLQKLEWLTEKIIQDHHLKDVRVLPQLHVLLWGNKRGV